MKCSGTVSVSACLQRWQRRRSGVTRRPLRHRQQLQWHPFITQLRPTQSSSRLSTRRRLLRKCMIIKWTLPFPEPTVLALEPVIVDAKSCSIKLYINYHNVLLLLSSAAFQLYLHVFTIPGTFSVYVQSSLLIADEQRRACC